MNNKKKLGLAIASILLSATASAGLYITPVVKGSVEESVDPKETQKGSGYVVKPIHEPKVISGESNEAGAYTMSEDDSSTHKVFSYGKNVPLKIALETVIPNSSDWLFRIDDGLSSNPVNWDGGETWEGVVSEISDSNPINIVVNHAEKVIGIAIPKDLASAYASRESKVFKLDGDISFRQNLYEWANQSGYQGVVFSPDIHDLDYPVPDAVFIGSIRGEDDKPGALYQLLSNLNKKARVPLSAEFAEGNKFIYIMKKVSKKEMY